MEGLNAYPMTGQENDHGEFDHLKFSNCDFLRVAMNQVGNGVLKPHADTPDCFPLT